MGDDEAVTGSGATRRALFLGAGAAGASVVLTACGGDEQSEGQSPGDGGGAQPPSGSAGPGALAKTTDIPVGGGKLFAAQGVVVTQPTEGTFKAFSAICTHQRCPVASVDGGTINCTCHGSKFSIEDGSVKAGPATTPLAAKEVKVTGDQIGLA
jgi:nitrite reductase/ring-hydroxylating ferredoxin subunit